MIVRLATASDAAAVCDITNPIKRDTLVTFTTALKTVLGITRSEHRFLVTEQGGQAVGFAGLARFRSGPGYDQTKEYAIQLAAPSQVPPDSVASHS